MYKSVSTPAQVDICYLPYILPICVCGEAASSKNSQHYQQIVRLYERTLPPRDVRLVDYWHSIWRMGWERGHWTFAWDSVLYLSASYMWFCPKDLRLHCVQMSLSIQTEQGWDEEGLRVRSCEEVVAHAEVRLSRCFGVSHTPISSPLPVLYKSAQ